MLPKIGIAQTRYQIALKNLNDVCESLIILPFKEAFENAWETDSHFVIYAVKDSENYPRLSKESLPRIRKTGGDVLSNIFVLDYDNPSHDSWTNEGLHDFIHCLSEKEKKNPILTDWTLFYTTKNGARFIYVLSEPIPVDQGQFICNGLIRDFALAGIKIDEKSSEWTRLFRLSKVNRDGVRTETESYFLQEFQEDKKLDWRKIIPSGKLKNYTQIDVDIENEPIPNDIGSYSLIWINGIVGDKKTDWHKQAEKRLKNRECYDCLFNGIAIAKEGQRDITIQKFVGQACSLLFSLPGTSPELIYALFLGPVSGLEPDTKTRSWKKVLWHSVLRYWAAEIQKSKEQEWERELAKEQSKSVGLSILEQIRKWTDNRNIHGPDPLALEYLNQRLICGTPIGRFYIMQRNGFYDKIGVSQNMIHSRVRELGMEGLITLEIETEKGYRKVTNQDLLDSYSTSVNGIEGAVGIEGSFINNFGCEDAKLVCNLFRRRDDIAPLYNEYVDEWLVKLAGNQYEKLKTWIAWSLAFDEGPICALSICGPPGCGKKLLVQGLSECIDSELYADSREMGQFQHLLLKTPFLVVNEGFPALKRDRDPADSFRMLVSGDPIDVNQKFKDTIRIRSPIRMIFTANNDQIIQTLIGNRDLSPEDREAIIQRLFHINCSREATQLLRMRGGMSYTDGWIKGDSGSPSNYIVARHFLHLYTQRHSFQRGLRLLVEGEESEEMINFIKTRSGSSPDIVECLIMMIENKLPQINSGLVIQDNRVLVTSSAVVDFVRHNLGKYNKNLGHNEVRRVLDGLVINDDKKYAYDIEINGVKKRARWKELNLVLLYQEAIEHGFRCSRLESLVRPQLLKQSVDSIIHATEVGKI